MNEFPTTPYSFGNWQPLLDAILDPVCLIDQGHTIIQCNNSFASLVSKPSAEIIGSRCWQLIHHQDGEAENCPVRRSIQTRERTTAIEQIGDRWFQVTADPLFDKQENFICAIHFFSDISEQKMEELKAQKSAALLNVILNGIQDGISVLDADLNIVMVNDRIKQMLPAGVSAVGEKCFQIYHQRQHPCEKCPSQRALQSGEKETAEVSFVDGDNKELTIELRVFPIKDKEGNITNVVEYGRDITEKKQHARERKGLAAQLESLWRIARLINEDYSVICQQVLREMASITKSRYCFFGFLSEDEKTMTIHAWSPEVMNDCGIHNKPQKFLVAEAGIWAKAVRQRQAVIINDYSRDDPEKKGLPSGHLSLSRIMAVPGFRADKIAMLGVVANKEGDYTEKNNHELNMFLTNVSLLLEKKQTEMAFAEQSVILKVGAEIGRVLTRTKSISKMLQECAEVINHGVGAAFTRIWLHNESEKMLELRASAGIYTHIDGGHSRISLGQYKIGKIAADRLPHLTNAVIGDPLVHNQDWAKKEGMVAFAGHPILVHDKLVGVLALFSRAPLSEAAFATISLVVDEIALGVERILQQEKIEKSEVQYRRLVENLEDKYFFYSHDTAGVFTYLSPSVTNILGYPIPEILAHYSNYLTDNPINDKVKTCTERSLQGEMQPAYEVEMLHQNGDIVTLEVLETPIFSGKEVIAVEGIAHDITEKKKYEEMLRRKNRALAALSQCREALQSSNSEEQFLGDICRIIVETGGHQLAWIGFAQNDHRKSIKPVAQQGREEGYLEEIAISWGDNQQGQGPTGTAIRESRIVICRNIHDDPIFAPWRATAAKYKYCSVVAIPVRIDEKRSGALTIYSSLVDAFDNEEIQLFEELAADVGIGIKSFREREARQKLERQLQQADKMDAIGTLAGGIAHDFNNILTPILGFSEMVMANLPQGSEDRNDLEIVHQSAVRAQKLVKQILTFSRQTEMQMLPCMIAPLIKEALKFLRSSLPANIEIKQNISNETILVNANTTFIHQIVMNLCTNSAHAMEDTGGTLAISLQTRRADHLPYQFTPVAESYAELVVEDSGVGMDPETMKRIFEPYFTTKPQGKGTGLGLSTVYGIIEQLQGKIFFESTVDVGTKVHVFLPVATEQDHQQQSNNVLLLGGGETIMIVDDEEFVCRSAARLLTALGYEVISATGSIEALELFSKEKARIDLVVTDQAMPKMTGVQLAEKMFEEKAGIPIILSTGYSATIDAEKARALGFKAFLLKPVMRDKLARTVRHVLDGEDAFGPEEETDFA